MNQKIFWCATALFSAPININAMFLLSPFDTGCEKMSSSLDTVSNSFENGSNSVSKSLDSAGNNIKETGEHIQKGMESAAHSVKEAAKIVSNITHTWDPESRNLSNALVKEFAVSTLGLAASLTGLYLLYQSIHKLLLEQETASKRTTTTPITLLTQKIKYSLQKNIRAITAGLIGLSFSYGGLKIIQQNNCLAKTL